MSLLHSVLARAVEDGLIQHNPTVGLAREIRSTAATEATEVEVFTREEVGRLLTVAEQDWPAWYPFLLSLARAGLRFGEAVGLEWRDVDFDQRMLIVRRSVNHGKRRLSAPKNGKGRRVDLSRYRKPHALRHSFASLLIEAGEPLTNIQQQLGHHSPGFTLTVYGHLLPRGDRWAVDRLDDPLPETTSSNPRATDVSPTLPVARDSHALDFDVSVLTH